VAEEGDHPAMSVHGSQVALGGPYLNLPAQVSAGLPTETGKEGGGGFKRRPAPDSTRGGEGEGRKS